MDPILMTFKSRPLEPKAKFKNGPNFLKNLHEGRSYEYKKIRE